jgi:hypothetical protein
MYGKLAELPTASECSATSHMQTDDGWPLALLKVE